VDEQIKQSEHSQRVKEIKLAQRQFKATNTAFSVVNFVSAQMVA
jgi:hypothetical protein